MRSAEPTTAVLERLFARVRDVTALRVTTRNAREVERVARDLARIAGLSFEDWVARFESPEGHREIEPMMRELTIGETYLFRGPVFDAVREVALPELIARRRSEGAHVLRLCSAGCATGEEAYSLAICALEALGQDTPWNVSVLGLDVNARFLERAEDACYGAWSARDAAPELLSRYFDRQDDRLCVKPVVRSRVRFQYANLATDPLPAPAIGAVGMDLVVCQNVVYYFEPEARTRLVTSLSHMLSPGGFLFFGPADLVTTEVPICRSRSVGDALAYQRVGRFSSVPRRRPSATTLRGITSLPPAPAPPAESARAPEPLAPLPPRFTTALALADDGDLLGALGELEALLADEKDHVAAHALHGFLLSELGELEAALDAFRRAIYLDSRHLLAHAGALAAARRLGRAALTRRFEQSLKALAREAPPRAKIQGWEGMTVARLLALFRDSPEETP
jgi:chemotaxis protein methyltransferase CheR